MYSKTLELNKTSYSEDVIRKSLYWCSEFCQWKLSETDNKWVVTFETDDQSIEDEITGFYKLLNDFVLREQIDRNTKHLRHKIIQNALTRLADND